MKKILVTLLLTAVFLSCDERLAELNRPKKNASEVGAETLFANGVREMFDLMVNTDVNVNVFRLYAQYWAQTTYPDESQFNQAGRRIPDNFWTRGYRDALKDLDEARKITNDTWEVRALSEGERDNWLAIIDICKAYIFAVQTDAFGAVPFSEALDPEILSPKYDAGSDVYANVIAMLDNAISMIDPDSPGFPEGQDPVYEGDAGGWLKFANSLKLKLAIITADVDAGRAATMVSQALAGGVIESNDDNTSITYQTGPPNTNPVWEDLVQSGRADYVVANTLVDKLLDLSDPRLPIFAEPLSDGVTFEGGIYGDQNTYAATSHIGDLFHQPGLEGVILDYSEVNFLLAEAAERGITTPMTAEEHYNEGIRASMEYWGIEDADIDSYLAQSEVAYATAEGGADWKQKIGVQQWIAFYNRGFEGWSTWRRLDFTGFNTPPLLTYDDIPERLIFPIEEATLNPSNLDAAIDLIGGQDGPNVRVFWDVE